MNRVQQYSLKSSRGLYHELGKLAVQYYLSIHDKASELNTYTYEIDSLSRASRVFWSTQRRTLYEQMVLEQNATKELILYIYKKESRYRRFLDY